MALATDLLTANRSPLSLRARIALACVGIGLVLSVVFAGATVYMTEDIESIIAKDILQGESSTSIAWPVGPSGSTAPDRALHRYVARGGDRRGIPAEFRDLPDGLQEYTGADDGERMVKIFSANGDRVYITLDLGSIDALEDRLDFALVLIIIGGTAISGGLGWWLAGRSVSPVSQLVAAVRGLPIQPTRTSLSQQFSPDEVGALASAIDEYQSRLVVARESERTFFAEASHELRTPLSVIRSVTDLLADERNIPVARRGRLRRLDRGIGELSDKIEAMFAMARSSWESLEFVDSVDLVQECLDDLRMHLPERTSVSFAGALPVRTRPRQAQWLLRMALRSVLTAHAEGDLEIIVDGLVCRMRTTTTDSSAGLPSVTTNGARIPPGLAGRFAESIGWQWSATVFEGGREVVITMEPAPSANGP